MKIPLSQVRRADILDIRTRLVKNHGISRTIERAVSVLKTCLKELYFREDVDRDLSAGVGQMTIDDQPRGAFTRADLALMFGQPGAWVDPRERAIFLLASGSGMRRGELLGLTWDQIDFKTRVINVDRQRRPGAGGSTAPKWGKVRLVPMPSKVAEALEALPRYSEFLFCGYSGEPFGITWFRRKFCEGMKRVGIDWEGRNLSPHSFRHTWNTLLLESGLAPHLLRPAGGWSSDRVQDGYTHTGITAIQNIVDSVF
jgi:integrase